MNLDGDDDLWLAGILDRALPHLAQGLGVVGWWYDVRGGAVRLPRIVSVGAHPDLMVRCHAMHDTPPPGVMRGYRGSTVCATASEMATIPVMRAHPSGGTSRSAPACSISSG